MTLLVDADWLARHLDEVIVVDVRWSPAGGIVETTRAFEAGHIPSAVFLEVDRDLAGDPNAGPGRHPLPSPAAFARTIGTAGIDDDALVVAYDDAGDSLAARLWWMLDGTGRHAALLDGGLAAWSGPLETGPGRPRPPVSVEPRSWPTDRLVDADAVADALRTGGATVLDVRAPERYRGDVEPLDPVAGHIPGARNAPWSRSLDTDGRFLPPEELRARFAALDVDGRTIAQCGSGITGCHTLFAMRLAGIGDARLYSGSWSDWVRDPGRPVATGDDPGTPG
jgi:thiosulfate/3-mercaptopyruvate sulfurtransferase